MMGVDVLTRKANESPSKDLSLCSIPSEILLWTLFWPNDSSIIPLCHSSFLVGVIFEENKLKTCNSNNYRISSMDNQYAYQSLFYLLSPEFNNKFTNYDILYLMSVTSSIHWTFLYSGLPFLRLSRSDSVDGRDSESQSGIYLRTTYNERVQTSESSMMTMEQSHSKKVLYNTRPTDINPRGFVQINFNYLCHILSSLSRNLLLLSNSYSQRERNECEHKRWPFLGQLPPHTTYIPTSSKPDRTIDNSGKTVKQSHNTSQQQQPEIKFGPWMMSVGILWSSRSLESGINAPRWMICERRLEMRDLIISHIFKSSCERWRRRSRGISFYRSHKHLLSSGTHRTTTTTAEPN